MHFSEMDYEVFPSPPDRKLVVDAGYLGTGRHISYGLVEVDVTRARELIKAHNERGGGKLSFTAFLIASLSEAIDAYPKVQACPDWRGRLVVFHDVDVVTMIEPSPGAVAIPYIIRGANHKTVQEISEEIRSIQSSKVRSEHLGLVALAPHLPRFVRLLFFKLLKKNPHWFKRMQGTVIVTSVGMFGKGGGWGVTFLPVNTLGLTVGGIALKPGVYAGEITIREYLSLTIAFDHDVVDGAPATRFANRLIELIESAAVLEVETGD